jgi:hypothetical protein
MLAVADGSAKQDIDGEVSYQRKCTGSAGTSSGRGKWRRSAWDAARMDGGARMLGEAVADT